MLEAPKIMNDPSVVFRPAVFVSNAAAAFGEALIQHCALDLVMHACFVSE